MGFEELTDNNFVDKEKEGETIVHLDDSVFLTPETRELSAAVDQEAEDLTKMLLAPSRSEVPHDTLMGNARNSISKIAINHDNQHRRLREALSQLAELEPHRGTELRAFTADGLLAADLDSVQKNNRVEAMRERVIRQGLNSETDVAGLRFFEQQYPAHLWGPKEFFEFSNRYRLLGSPLDEVRLFETSRNSIFRNAPRAREFYALALTKLGRLPDALTVCALLKKEGHQDGLVYGIEGDVYKQLLETTKDPLEQTEYREAASSAYQEGFRRGISSFCALGWSEMTVVNLVQLMRAQQTSPSPEVTQAIAEKEAMLLRQNKLIKAAITLQGGDESLDFWTHLGALELEALEGRDRAALRASAIRVCASEGASEHRRMTMAKRFTDLSAHYAELGAASRKEEWRVIADNLAEASELLRKNVRDAESPGAEQKEKNELAYYKSRSISFRALTGSVTPTYINGGIGRAGSRVPDLMIGREDVRAFEYIITSLGIAEEADPRVIKGVIEEFVRTCFSVSDLQNLQGELHKKFDDTSDGGIELGGIAREDRRETRSMTNLAASLLIGVGDCRETMYAMGGLFATQQRMRTRARANEALAALNEGDMARADTIIDRDMREVMRYEMRGQHAAVYVAGADVRAKYDMVMGSHNQAIAAARPDGKKDLAYVEDHTLSQLCDTETDTIELADAFYNNGEYNGPYNFGNGTYDLTSDHLTPAGTRTLELPDGSTEEASVYLQPLPYSKTDYQRSLGESDLPDTFRIMGRVFIGNLRLEMERVREGNSKFPAVFERILAWHRSKQEK